jgi:hypothetical protein
VRAELILLGRWRLHVLGEQRDLRRIVIAEGDRFPALKRRFQERFVKAFVDGCMAFANGTEEER